ncbi:EAL domain-containing protein [Sphingobium cupriresistens]|uniref:EAL domain-containing protein n=1 Tax=Sphingobium cupriresistens TaxID=1132417 RepID=A0A8G1ZE18_9SPHN|nr:EAL domain-containing protein [Sphingobium cupriresistens]RYM05607.1 EAL domain-containing protein [Sphingobium cupriresistens]
MMTNVLASGPGIGSPAFSFDRNFLRSGDLLLALRINNFCHIEAVYGQRVATAAAMEIRDALERWVPGTQAHLSRDDLIEAAVPLSSRNRQLALATMIESLCMGFMLHPLLVEEHKFHVSVSAGYAQIIEIYTPENAVALLEECHDMLRATWSAPEFNAAWGKEWKAGYRTDMASAVTFLNQIDRGETFLAWQPIVKADKKGTILYYEALLRISSEDGTHISCGQAIRCLERLGLSRVLDRHCVSAVLDQLEDDPIVCLGVNVSAQNASFHLNGQDAFWNELRKRLAENRSLGPRLVIEITESWPASSQKDLSDFVRTLSRFGCRIAIDDFGSGHNGLRQLLTLKPDIVKLDSFFMRTAGETEQTRNTFRHALGLARSLVPLVIVEGVETAAHEQMAREEGATWLQGFQLSHPSLVRGWLDASYRDCVQALLDFKAHFKRPCDDSPAA